MLKNNFLWSVYAFIIECYYMHDMLYHGNN